jgi:hypothetical protein
MRSYAGHMWLASVPSLLLGCGATKGLTATFATTLRCLSVAVCRGTAAVKYVDRLPVVAHCRCILSVCAMSAI